MNRFNKVMSKFGQYKTSIFVIMTYFVMLVWNYLTPLWADDLEFAHTSIKKAIEYSFQEYFNWNGRFFGQTISRILASMNQLLEAFLNAGIFILLTVLIVKIATIKFKPKFNSNFFFIRYVLTLALMFIFVSSFGEIVFWRAGAGNYLWGCSFGLMFLYLYLNSLQGHNYKGIVKYLAFPISLIGGWSNENGSGGILLVALIFSFIAIKGGKKISKIGLSWLGMYGIGYLFLILSPASKKRTLISKGAEYLQQSHIKRFVYGFLQVSEYVLNNYLILFSCIAVLLIFAIIFWQKNKEWITPATFIFAGVATDYVMTFSPLEQDTGRVYFGGTVLLIIAIITLIPGELRSLEKSYQAFIISVVTVFIGVGFLTAMSGIWDSVLSSIAVNERYTTINQLKAEKGSNKVFKINKLTYYAKTKFVPQKNLGDILKNANGYPNFVYKHYFGIKGVELK